jgi:ribosomal protein S18 acetylase RimI-like enzyme
MPVPDLEISPLHPSEADTAVALWHACGLTRPWNDPHADLALAMRGPASAVLGGRRVGALVATIMLGADGHRAWVYYLAVAPEQRRHGIGRAMMQAAEAWAATQRMPKIQLMVRGEKRAVVGFYEALGYTLSDTVVLGRRLDGA